MRWVPNFLQGREGLAALPLQVPGSAEPSHSHRQTMRSGHHIIEWRRRHTYWCKHWNFHTRKGGRFHNLVIMSVTLWKLRIGRGGGKSRTALAAEFKSGESKSKTVTSIKAALHGQTLATNTFGVNTMMETSANRIISTGRAINTGTT